MNKQNIAKNSYFQLKSWKDYKALQKKVIEQEFSWTGLLVSCSIAFFVVVSSAFALGMLCNSIEASIPEAKADTLKLNLIDSVRKA